MTTLKTAVQQTSKNDEIINWFTSYLPVSSYKFHQIKCIAITYSFELLFPSFISPPECRLSIFFSVTLFAENRHSGLNGTLNKGHLHE